MRLRAWLDSLCPRRHREGCNWGAVMKVHLHDEQFDGTMHSWCGRGSEVAGEDDFEAIDPDKRCKLCDREMFPRGQPDWHLKVAQERQRKLVTDRIAAQFHGKGGPKP
jgi:hypothetical protein